jgi:3-oxoacyl-[acyl-carrier-protein] synthase III
VLNQILRATMAALDDAGLKPHDIDGIVTAMPMPTVEHLAANLGIPDLRYSASSNIGAAAAPVAALQTGAMAVALGLANTVLIPVGWNAFSGGGGRGAGRSAPTGLPPSFRLTHGRVLHAVRAGGAGAMVCLGQFLYIEHATRQPIAAALAEALLEQPPLEVWRRNFRCRTMKPLVAAPP